jgi:hypothetical protein
MKIFPTSNPCFDVMPQMPKTCSHRIPCIASAPGLVSPLITFSAKKVITRAATTSEPMTEDAIYRVARVLTSNDSTYPTI